jgi:hypothetical protein
MGWRAKRLELFAQALALPASEALTQAKSRLALTRARQLRVLQAQLDDYHQRWREDPVEDVANGPLLRCGAPSEKPAQTRLLGAQTANRLTGLSHVNNFA